MGDERPLEHQGTTQNQKGPGAMAPVGKCNYADRRIVLRQIKLNQALLASA
jgi:hypothetical protein